MLKIPGRGIEVVAPTCVNSHGRPAAVVVNRIDAVGADQAGSATDYGSAGGLRRPAKGLLAHMYTLSAAAARESPLRHMTCDNLFRRYLSVNDQPVKNAFDRDENRSDTSQCGEAYALSVTAEPLMNLLLGCEVQGVSQRLIRGVGVVTPLVMACLLGCMTPVQGQSADTQESAIPIPIEHVGKIVAIIHRAAAESHAQLRQFVAETLAPALSEDPSTLRVVISLPIDADSAEYAVESFIEVYTSVEALPTIARDLRALAGPDRRVDAYYVDEKKPRSWQQTWPDGTPSPGIRLIALMVRRSGIDRAAFAADWRDRHTAIALSQSVGTLNYSQNVVIEALGDNVPEIDGIACEQFESADFGDLRRKNYPEEFARGIASARRFTDFDRNRHQLMIETVVKSASPARFYPSSIDSD